MVESSALQLVFTAAKTQELALTQLSDHLLSMGYKGVTPSVLSFLSALDCGANYASDIARNLGVSRQMVAKTVRELTDKGFLCVIQDAGRQKPIEFTLEGEQLIANARLWLSNVDTRAQHQLGENRLRSLAEGLSEVNQLLGNIEKE